MRTINLGALYLEAPDMTQYIRTDTLVELTSLIHREYAKLRETHDVVFVDTDPYPNFDALKAHHDRGSFFVFSGGSESGLFDAETNLMFRAIHDHHHCIANADFSLSGETDTYYHIAALTHHAEAKQVLYSEIVLQAAAYYHLGRFPDIQKVVLV